MESLRSGEEIRAVIHYAKCGREHPQNKPDTIPDIIASMQITTWEYFSRNSIRNSHAFVVFSDSRLIENPIGKGFVFNYGKMRISDNDSVMVYARYLHPRSHRSMMYQRYRCRIDNGTGIHGISLYKNHKSDGNE